MSSVVNEKKGYTKSTTLTDEIILRYKIFNVHTPNVKTLDS